MIFFGESHDVTKCDISSGAYDLLMHKPIREPAVCVVRYSTVKHGNKVDVRFPIRNVFRTF